MTTRMLGKQGILDVLNPELSPRERPWQIQRFLELNTIELKGYPFAGRELGRSDDGTRVVREWKFLFPAFKKEWKLRDLVWLLETDRRGELAQYLDMCREVTILEFEQSGKEPVSLKVELKPGTENRHETLYQITYLNIVKQDLAAIYADVKELLWFNGTEPKSKYATVYAHRLIYTWLTGENLFELHIHHRDYNGSNNRLCNMEPVTEAVHAAFHGDTFDKIRVIFSDAHDPVQEVNANPITSETTSSGPRERGQGESEWDAGLPVQLSLFSDEELRALEEQTPSSYWSLGPGQCRRRGRRPMASQPRT